MYAAAQACRRGCPAVRGLRPRRRVTRVVTKTAAADDDGVVDAEVVDEGPDESAEGTK